ncbi:MAG: hypothetical protein ACYDER_02730 [Ktedonobacteraceae bacterium]
MFTQEPFESGSPSSHLYTWHIQQIPHLEQYLRLIPYSQGTVMGFQG